MATETKQLSDINEPISALVAQLKNLGVDRIAIEDHGKVVGALISAKDFERLGQLEPPVDDVWAWMDDMSARFSDVSEDELMKEALKARAEIHAEVDAAKAASAPE